MIYYLYMYNIRKMNLDFKNISIQNILLLIGSGGIGVIIVALINFTVSTKSLDINKESYIDERYIELVKTCLSENEKLKKNVELLQLQNNDLYKKDFINQIELNKLKSQYYLLDGQIRSAPFPMWQKDINLKMQWLNPAYEIIFLKELGFTAMDYIGKYDSDIWGQETGMIFSKHDNQVIKQRKELTFIEYVKKCNGCSEVYKLQVLKYPIIVGNNVVGVGGACFILEEIDKPT